MSLGRREIVVVTVSWRPCGIGSKRVWRLTCPSVSLDDVTARRGNRCAKVGLRQSTKESGHGPMVAEVPADPSAGQGQTVALPRRAPAFRPVPLLARSVARNHRSPLSRHAQPEPRYRFNNEAHGDPFSSLGIPARVSAQSPKATRASPRPCTLGRSAALYRDKAARQHLVEKCRTCSISVLRLYYSLIIQIHRQTQIANRQPSSSILRHFLFARQLTRNSAQVRAAL